MILKILRALAPVAAQVRVQTIVPEPFVVSGADNSDQFSVSSGQFRSLFTVSWRYFLPFTGAAPPLARLAPYFDRLCLRLATPTESRVPRTT